MADPSHPRVKQRSLVAAAPKPVASQAVSRSLPARHVLQQKVVSAPAKMSATRIAPPKPQIYRPQPTPKVLQKKSHVAVVAQTVTQKTAPSTASAIAAGVLQRHTAQKFPTPGSNGSRSPKAPPAYQPQSTPKVLQAKSRPMGINHDPGPFSKTPGRNYGGMRDAGRSTAPVTSVQLRNTIQRAQAALQDYPCHYECEAHHLVTFNETGPVDSHRDQECPLRCNKKLHDLQDDDDGLYYCHNIACNQFHAKSQMAGVCGQCNKQKVCLSDAPAYVKQAEDDAGPSKADRQLKAVMDKAAAWVKSSGSHHKSTGGAHTASASEKHSAAHGSKKQVRQTYMADLAALMSADEVSPKLKAEAQKVMKAVENK
jgi:hypothetical protein